ncbi:hypothetical protein PoB_005685400 [Plakobranchus ocellatus]|uniref:Uncharacterized protein n=1 Tax=Plakobranchus ocellatus TaxID=259542 RepID=A0AAV4CCN9_9GAST|nr:hypothetical protein PoB_005685400 [Plakobranchus ocellatus]
MCLKSRCLCLATAHKQFGDLAFLEQGRNCCLLNLLAARTFIEKAMQTNLGAGPRQSSFSVYKSGLSQLVTRNKISSDLGFAQSSALLIRHTDRVWQLWPGKTRLTTFRSRPPRHRK